ncbi:MAG TPA: cupin domain-containing protein [Nitrospira sp.]|nr:cupin domain-containing protein [Nitrospira sp.]
MSYPDPRYRKNHGEVSAVLRQAARSPELQIGPVSSVSYVATGSSTQGRFGLYRWDAAPHAPGPSAHFHRTMSESFYVLSGSMRLFDGECWIEAKAGDFFYVPEGGIHAFHNDSDEPSSMLILFAPGAPREGYFEALAEKAAGRPFTEAEWKEICERHDNYFV